MSMSIRLSRLLLAAALLAGCGQQLVHYPDQMCSDGKKNLSETDVDCGGLCAKCGDGKTCSTANDCTSNLCLNGVCSSGPALCTDGKKDGDETDVDCGGTRCSKCGDGKTCSVAIDCQSGVCQNGVCQAATCTDGIENGKETDVDCGGGTCPACASGKTCQMNSDCDKGVCVDGKCAPASCTDGVKNGDETDVDCGGSCAACVDGKACGKDTDCTSGVCTAGVCAAATCSDHVQNGMETGTDCGGPTCPKCADGMGCKTAADCAAGVCLNGKCAPSSCIDNVKNGDETDVDCGGSCPACGTGGKCAMASDCKSLVCTGGVCVAPACNDTIKNGDETDVDCGGSCTPCQIGQHCLHMPDCVTLACFNNVCVAPSCTDKILNGTETDIDCGGGTCPGCADNLKCLVPSDCASGVCTNGTCTPATCSDGVKNGQETDVDCGGPTCNPCGANLGCTKASDCLSGVCTKGVCQAPTCKDGVQNGAETGIDCGGGSCPTCGVGVGCQANADCWDNQCVASTSDGGVSSSVCGSNATVAVGNVTGAPAFDPSADGSKLVVTDSSGNITVNRVASLLAIARYLYVSNSGEGTVSKIDPSNFTEVTRYCTAPGCNADPSRASVSLDGDVGVANRGWYFYNNQPHPDRASAVKIAGDISRCVDRNGNGKIDTNTVGGSIAPGSQFYWPANQPYSPDECVLWWTSLTHDRFGNFVGGVGSLPRSATWDSKPSPTGSLSSNFYVGLFNTDELVQLDGATGNVKAQVPVPGAPYSSVFDRFGNLWIRDGAGSALIKVDTKAVDANGKQTLPATIVTYMPCNYAITADRRGYIYTAGNTCVSRFDPQNPGAGWQVLQLPNACFPRGPSLDSAFNLWVPDTCYGGYHVDASAPITGTGAGPMVLKKQIPLTPNVSAYFLGTAVDGNATPFFINTEDGNLEDPAGPNGTVYRVDWKNNYALSQIRVGRTPYVYSDLSGSQLALSAPTTGSYRKTFAAYCGSQAVWKQLTWTDTTPSLTSVQVRYRSAKDLTSLQNAPFITVGTEPPPIPQPVNINLNGADPSYFQVEFDISTQDTANLPTLSSVQATYSCPTP